MRDLKDLKEEDEPGSRRKIPTVAIVALLGLLVFFALMLFFRGGEEELPLQGPVAGAVPAPPADPPSTPDPNAGEEKTPLDPAVKPGGIRFSEKKEEFSTSPAGESLSPSGEVKSIESEDLTFFKTLKDKKGGAALQPKKETAAKASPKKSPAEAAAKPTALSPSSGSKRFTVQVASFSEKKGADLLAEKLKKKGFDAYIVSGEVPQKGRWHRVRVGRYSNRMEAQQAGDRLRTSEKLDFFVISD